MPVLLIFFAPPRLCRQSAALARVAALCRLLRVLRGARCAARVGPHRARAIHPPAGTPPSQSATSPSLMR
eukprot:3991808-Pleurochrysis_carterae.AAC.1